NNLVDIEIHADKEEERALKREIEEGFRRYLEAWKRASEMSGDARRAETKRARDLLENDTLKPCLKLRDFNVRLIEESSLERRRAVERLAWALGAIGGVGGLAGVVLGYGVARSLRRSLHRLQIHVQDAAGKLGPSWPDIVLTEEGDLERLHEQVQGLA